MKVNWFSIFSLFFTTLPLAIYAAALHVPMHIQMPIFMGLGFIWGLIWPGVKKA